MVFLPRALRLAAWAVSFRVRRAASGTALRRRRSGGGRHASGPAAAAPRRTSVADPLFARRKDGRRIARELIARARRLRLVLPVTASADSHPPRPAECWVTVPPARAAWNFSERQDAGALDAGAADCSAAEVVACTGASEAIADAIAARRANSRREMPARDFALSATSG